MPLRMLIRMSAGDLNAYVGLLGFGAGVFTGTAALKRGFTLGRAYPSSNGSGAGAARTSDSFASII